MDERRRGSLAHWRKGQAGEYIPPEDIEDDSPLVRDVNSPNPRSIGEKAIYRVVHNLYHKAGLKRRNQDGGYDLRVHSLRKFFKTQMKARGVDSDYIDYVMGHLLDTYHDVQSKGVEFLRSIYAKADLSIKPRTGMTKLDIAKEVLRSFGLEPEKVLVKDAFAEPHRVIAYSQKRENREVKLLTRTLIDHIRDEVTKAAASKDLGR